LDIKVLKLQFLMLDGNVKSKVVARATKTNKQMKTLVLVHLHTQTATNQIDYEDIVIVVINCSQAEETATASENNDGRDW